MNELNIQQVCCFLWKSESEAKLLDVRSPAFTRVESSCGYAVSNRVQYRRYLKCTCSTERCWRGLRAKYLYISRAIFSDLFHFHSLVPQQHDGRNICFIVDFEVLQGSSSITILPAPNIRELEENDDDDDSFQDCSPWLDLTWCSCNCTTLPQLWNVLLESCIETAEEQESEGEGSSRHDLKLRR